MKRKFLISVALCLSALILLSCTNLLDAEKKSSDTTGISLTLPYAKANNEGVSRAGQNSGNKRSLHFSVTFRHESGDEKTFEGESGETILFENILTGNYSINVKAYDDNKVLIYEGNSEALVKEGKTTSVTIKLNKLDIIEINLLSHTDEQAGMIEKYIKEHPDCGIQLNFKKVETTNGEYSSFLDAALTGASNEFIPDIYSAESAFVKRYTSGVMGDKALPYSEFIPDLDTKLQNAKIAQYTVDIGKNSSGQVVGLAYQTTGGVFIYRRSVAKKVFGKDDPESVSSEIGGGSGTWTNFWKAAKKCGEQEVAILSGADDLWHPLEGSASNGWIKDGQLYIDPEREAFLDYAKDLYVNKWTNKTEQWNPEWTADIRKEGEKPVLGFFGPAWLINFVLEPACESDDRDWAICEAPVGFSWGGTWMMANKKLLEDKSEEGKKKLEAVKNILEWITLDATEEGLQYQWANGLLGNAGDTVASELVMENSDGSLNFLNGQNMFDYYIPANKKAPSGLITEYDEKITQLWIFEANKYAQGLSSREQALNNFRFAVYCQLSLMSDGFNSEGFVYETEHVRAEPAPDGKGVKLTISAKEGEEWKNDWYRVTEIKSGMYIQFKDNSVPTPGNPVVCYWPFTNNGESYVFDCELKINNDSDEAIHETLYSVANGSYAQVSVNSDGVNGFKPQITDLTNPKVTLSKDIRSSVTTSGNVTAAYDFGVCTTDENGYYNWIDWLNSIGPEFTDSILYDSAQGITILNYDKDTVFKLKKNKHLYIDLNLEFNVEGLSECYRYKESFKSDIYDASSVISSLSTNQHISVAPHEEGIQVTLRYLPGEAEWVDRNDVICLTEDGQDGVTFHVDVLSNFEDEQVPASHRGNLAPTAATPVKTYIFPFTQKDKEYEFILAGPLDKNEGWQNEYVCCKAGGGVGELIDVDAWNKDIKVTDIDYQNHSFRISGDVASIIDNSSKVFSSAFLWPDVRPGVDGNCRDKKFGYASRRLCIIGESDEYNRTLSDLENPLLIENSPAFVNGELAPDDYDNENVFAVLEEWNNKFWVIMTIEEIQLTAYPDMTFHLHWK